jgi:electron transfer flavoprotein alpha subunit
VAQYSCDAFDRAIEAQAKAETPEILLLGHTPNGWDVAPLLAAGLGVPLATECSAVAFEGGRPVFTRKVFNGKFVQVVEMTGCRPAIATMQRGAAPAFAGKTEGTVRQADPGIAPGELQARFVEIRKGQSAGVDLTQAPIIVAGGRGLGAAEKFSVIRDLADALGGQVGASRPVTDAGWLPHEHQIGSSGVTVSPKLYIAAGISGAIQHLVGMRGSGYIVAKDADAPIFGVADVGVVGDLFEIVPALARAVRGARG